uniref:broad substrate specificity ATP-binding cassette transporter ABCG2-like n=1 Tax=Ictidomys tridecemlineatus TaxID=43179 RepID=UPI001A9D81F6|nr:broad substrate specificity ATP-binding cassette transporter ABCG2-like [Ictidomys tridecemlineatus]
MVDDVVMHTLSVRENLWFSAALRLPTTMTKQEKKERINNIIKELDLEKVADSKVESKGERKKTSIGMELILNPRILFLDEPTTGLDGRTANDVFTLLKRISQQGRTIIFTIHHPCYSIFRLFDSLTILASGELMYHGPAQKALEYFQSAGLVRKEIPYVTSFVHQLIGLNRRSFQNFTGNPQYWATLIISTFVVGLVTGVMFILLRDICSEIHNRALMLFYLMSYQCGFSKWTVQHFVLQKKRFVHESSSGYYRVSSYFFGSLLSDLLLEMFLTSFVCICTLYFIVVSKPGVETFFIMFLTLLALGFSSISITLAIVAGHTDGNTAMRITDSYFTFMMILLGLSLYFGTRTTQFSWVQYFSIPYYGFMALQHNEFLGRNFCPSLNITNGNNYPDYVICFGEEFLLMQDMDLSSWGLWKNHVALNILIFIFLIIAYVRMLYLERNS